MDKKKIGIWYGTIPDDPIKAKEHIEKINKRVKLEKIFDKCKPILDRLGKKETTDQDIWNFKNLIEKNQCKRCKHKKYSERFTIDSSLPEDYYRNKEYDEE